MKQIKGPRPAFLAAAVFVMTVVAFPVAAAASQGNSSADITVEAGCFSVEASSSKDISHVEIYFVNGDYLEIDVNSPTYSATFDDQIDHVIVKSGTSEEGDAAPETCSSDGGDGGGGDGGTGGGGDGGNGGTDGGGGDGGTGGGGDGGNGGTDGGGNGGNGGDGGTGGGDGDGGAIGGGGDGGGGDDVLSGGTTGPSASVGSDVLGKRVSRGASDGATAAAAAEDVAASGGALPFTGAALLAYVLTGLGLMGAGSAVMLRVRRK